MAALLQDTFGRSDTTIETVVCCRTQKRGAAHLSHSVLRCIISEQRYLHCSGNYCPWNCNRGGEFCVENERFCTLLRCHTQNVQQAFASSFNKTIS